MLETINIVIRICGNQHLTHRHTHTDKYTQHRAWHRCGIYEQKKHLRTHSKKSKMGKQKKMYKNENLCFLSCSFTHAARE